jgi:hypothetical protein
MGRQDRVKKVSDTPFAAVCEDEEYALPELTPGESLQGHVRKVTPQDTFWDAFNDRRSDETGAHEGALDEVAQALLFHVQRHNAVLKPYVLLKKN